MNLDLLGDNVPQIRQWLYLILLLAVVACQKPAKLDIPSLSSEPKKEEPQRIEENPDTLGLDHAPWIEPWEKNFDRRLDALTVECEGGQCPGSVATFISQSLQNDGKISYKVCGAALKDKNHVITARHCFDEKLLQAGTPCSDGGYFLFPATATQPAVSARCAEVVQHNELHKELTSTKRQPDWVVLRLDRPILDRASPLLEGGLKEGQALRFYKPMYDRENSVVKIHNYECSNVSRSQLLPSATHANAPMFLIHCDRLFSPGYSGFGIYTEDGKLAATESHSVENLYTGQEHSYFAVASNAACTAEDLSPEMVNHCKWQPEDQDILKDRLFTLIYKEALEAHQNLFLETVASRGPKAVRWATVDLEKISLLPESHKPLYTDFSKTGGIEKMTPSLQERLTQASLLMAPGIPQCIETSELAGDSMMTEVPYAYVTTYTNSLEQIIIDSQIRWAAAQILYREKLDLYGYNPTSAISESPHKLDSKGHPFSRVYGDTKIGAIDIPACK